MATTATLTAATTFVRFMVAYFGAKYVKSLNERFDDGRIYFIVNEVSRIARGGDYAEVARDFDQAAYALGWVVETGRINGATHMALRQMKVRDLLKLVAQICDKGINQGEVAAWLMQLNLEPAK